MHRSKSYHLLCVMGGTFHPSFFAQMALTSWLRRLPGVRVQVVHDIEVLATMRLERFSGLLFFFHAAQISDEALEAVDRFVDDGGGLIALHSAAASFKDAPLYSAIIGGRFLHHGPIAPFEIRQTSIAGDFAGGGSTPEQIAENPAQTASPHLAPDFSRTERFTVRDELYIHEYDPDNYVHFVVDTENGPEPMVWSRLHGKGRVFYLAPGHRTETLRNPSIRHILRQGIRWALNPDDLP